MARQDFDPYLVLGVLPTATQAEITHAYRDRLRAHHPDTRHKPPSQTADDDLRRVLAAYNLLIKRNLVPASQLFVIGHGGNHPIVSNATPEGKARNRRIEFVVYPERVANR